MLPRMKLKYCIYHFTDVLFFVFVAFMNVCDCVSYDVNAMLFFLHECCY